MHSELELEQARNLVKGIDIPVRPAVLQKIMELQSSDDPSIDKIAKVISVGVLKAVISPLYGMKNRMSSIQQAVVLLGLNNVLNIVIGLSLRLEIGGNFNVAVERFWDTASDVVLISAGLAKELRHTPSDEAYTLGLFHDCGIPLLMKKDPNYVQLLKVANSSVEKGFTDVEDEQINTNHAVVGYYVAKSWRLPSHICKAILNHHESDMLASGEVELSYLLVNLKMAEAISHSVRRVNDHPDWERIRGKVFEFLKISEKDFEELKEDISDKLADAA